MKDQGKKDNNKKDHYVPVFYLKEFGNLFNKEKDIWKIWVYDKEQQKSFYSNIDETLSKNYFYKFLNEEKNSIFDSRLQDFESQFAPFIKKILHTINREVKFNQLNSSIFKKPIKEKFSEILAVQLIRTPKTRENLQFINNENSSITNDYVENLVASYTDTIKKQFPNLNNNLIEIFRDHWKNTINEYRQIYQKNPAKGHYNYFERNLKKLQEEFYNCNWVIGLNNTDNAFYTSDHPLAFTENGETILFPLSSKVILILQTNNSFLNNSKQILNLEKTDIENFNKIQVLNSKRFICCKNDDFELVRSHRL